MLAARCWTFAYCPRRSSGSARLLAHPPRCRHRSASDGPYLTARSFSTPCMLLAWLGALDMTDRRPITETGRRRGFYTLGRQHRTLAGAMHPLMAAYALVGDTDAACACARGSQPFLQWARRAYPRQRWPSPPASNISRNRRALDYIRIALTRTYWFPARWSWYELAGLAAPLAILAAFALRSPARRDSFHRSAKRAARWPAWPSCSPHCLADWRCCLRAPQQLRIW